MCGLICLNTISENYLVAREVFAHLLRRYNECWCLICTPWTTIRRPQYSSWFLFDSLFTLLPKESYLFSSRTI